MDDEKNLDKSTVDDGAAEDHTPVEDGDHEPAASKRTSLKAFMLSWRLAVIIPIFIIAIGGPFAWVFWIHPAMEAQHADDVASTTVVPYDHSWSSGKADSSLLDGLDVNSNQYTIKYKANAISDDKSVGRSASTSCMVFKGKDMNPKHHVKIVIAYGDDKSRNLLSEQASQFSYAMKNGTISTEVCFLLTDSEYSALATEALAEIDYNDPTFTWQAMQSLSQVDVTEFKSTSDMSKFILKVVDNLKKDGFKENAKSTISEKSLKTGSFIQWARIMTNKSAVPTVPVFYLDGDNLSDTTVFKMYNPDAMYKKLESLK